MWLAVLVVLGEMLLAALGEGAQHTHRCDTLHAYGTVWLLLCQALNDELACAKGEAGECRREVEDVQRKVRQQGRAAQQNQAGDGRWTQQPAPVVCCVFA